LPPSNAWYGATAPQTVMSIMFTPTRDAFTRRKIVVIAAVAL
jgi:hypothetical protein